MPVISTHSQADIVRQLLIDKGVGTAPLDNDTWPVYKTKEPDRPDEVITVYDTAGVIQGFSQIDGECQEDLGIMIRVRAGKDEIARAKARAIALLLDQGVYHDLVTVDATNYCVTCITRTSDVMTLGNVPGSNRRAFTVNALIDVTETA